MSCFRFCEVAGLGACGMWCLEASLLMHRTPWMCNPVLLVNIHASPNFLRLTATRRAIALLRSDGPLVPSCSVAHV